MHIMADKRFAALLALGFPTTVLLCGSDKLSGGSDRAAALCRLIDGKQEHPRPLHQRWFGYGVDALQEYCSWFKPAGRRAEENILALTLLFPFLYGGALAASLGWIWVTLGRPFHPAWIIAPLVVITMADWLENLIQLAQLRHYVSSNEQCVQSLWIQLSSLATIIKLWIASGLYVSLAGLVLKMLLTFSGRRLASDAVE